MSPNHICSHLEPAQGPPPPVAVSASGWKVPSTCRHPGSQHPKGSMGSSRGPRCRLVLGGTSFPGLWASRHLCPPQDSTQTAGKTVTDPEINLCTGVLADFRFALGGFSHTCQNPSSLDFFSLLLSPCSAQPRCWGDTVTGAWEATRRTSPWGVPQPAVSALGLGWRRSQDGDQCRPALSCGERW